MSAEEASGDEFEVNEMSRGKKWGNNNNNYKCSNTAIVTTLMADPSTTSLKTTNKVNLGNKKVRTPK